MDSHQSHKSFRKLKSENGTNAGFWNQSWDQVPTKSKHPFSTNHTRLEPNIPKSGGRYEP
jgi:hypothetical protein